ncbi:response regulator transcription factor [Pedobacter agri]|uniref:response regulator transcription factor n=1 Tax=Pedobacter agri TaxID=454586 RepID=UPI002930E9D7|nr:LuxR C-terminal-related transcriptional regulator [Pedobacter agri]
MFNQLKISLFDLDITIRELTVLDFIADGMTNKEIGDKIFLSKRTIEGIRESLLVKTNSKNTAALIAFSFRSGILT